jgi:hypothetical protein
MKRLVLPVVIATSLPQLVVAQDRAEVLRAK